MPIFAGLDCGGSSTRVLAMDSGGEVVFQGQGGPANLASTPERKLEGSLQNSTKDCPPVDYVCGCFAGLLTPEDRTRAESYLSQIFCGAKIRATPDYAAALYASDDNANLCVVAGTGSLVCSRGPGGIVKSGGRGFLLGDEGSAFQYGRSALQSYLSNPDDASIQLRTAVEKLFGETEEAAILSRLYRYGSPQATLAKLAKPCGVDASHGVQYAVSALTFHSKSLAEVIARHVSINLPGQRSLVMSLAGGLWQTAGVFKESLMKELSEITKGIEIVAQRIQHPPVLGAVRLAQEMVNGD